MGRLDTLDPVNLSNLVQRLAKERALFEQIFKTLQEGVLVITSDGIIEYANEAAQRLIDMSGDGLTGQTLWRLIPGLRPSLSGEAETVGPFVTREFELSYPEPRTVRLYMVPIRGDIRGGDPTCAFPSFNCHQKERTPTGVISWGPVPGVGAKGGH